MWRFLQLLTGKKPVPDSITLLAISRSEADKRLLRRICDRMNWQLVVAESVEEALASIRRWKAAVILCDRDVPGVDWRNALRDLSATYPVSVILASPVADDYLWDEVFHCGGYDILSKPLREEQIVSTVNLALSYRKTGLMR